MSQMMTIRPAQITDAKAICGLVNYYAERGRMLHRSLESVYASLRDFLVAEADGDVVGCVAIAIFWADLAEVKSLAVASGRRGEGIGGKLLEAAIAAAKKLGIRKLFALTYEQGFFDRHGFAVAQRDALPEKVWRECIHCPKVDACDETAVMLDLATPAPARARKSRQPAAKSARSRK